MKGNIYDKVKNGKTFAAFDLLVYALVILICAGLFLGFVIIPKHDSGNGFIVYYKDEKIFSFYYDDLKYDVEEFDGSVNVENTDPEKGLYTITVFMGGEKNYNVLSVSAKDKTVKVAEANCSYRKDCVHTPEIKDGSGAIYCLPHGLKILPLKNEYRPVNAG